MKQLNSSHNPNYHCVEVYMKWSLQQKQTVVEIQDFGASEATVIKLLNCMNPKQLCYSVALGDVDKAKCTYCFKDNRAGESTNKRAYQTGEVRRKLIRRELQRCILFALPWRGWRCRRIKGLKKNKGM